MESTGRFPLLHHTSSPIDSNRRYGTMTAQRGASRSLCFTPSQCSAIAQLWACAGKYLCMLNIGLIASLPVLLIPLVTSGSFHIKLSTDDINDLVSIIYIVMPIGSVLAALPIKTTRKPPIILTQAVMAASWLGTYYSTQEWHLLIARAFGGIGITLSQPHIACYIGEVTEPSLRGIYGSLTQTMGILGALIVSSLVYINSFHLSVIICGSFAIFSTVYLFSIPESPLLLIEHKEYKKAFNSLRKLRGWKWGNERDIKEEFHQLMKHYAQKGNHENVKSLSDSLDGRDNYLIVSQKPEGQIQNAFLSNSSIDNADYIWKERRNSNLMNHSLNENLYPTIFPTQDIPEYYVFNKDYRSNENLLVDEGAKDSPEEILPTTDNDLPWYRFLFTPSMYKPFCILAVSTVFVVGPGAHAINTYLSYILNEYRVNKFYSPILTMITCGMLAGNLTSTILVSRLGKKVLILLSTIGSGLSYIGLVIASIYGPSLRSEVRLGLVGFLLVWTIFMEELGLRTLYHSLLAELFPMRGKKIGASLIVLIICMNGILIGQKFLDLLSICGVAGVMSMNTVLSFSATVFYYFFFTETEGKTLKEIEKDFNCR